MINETLNASVISFYAALIEDIIVLFPTSKEALIRDLDEITKRVQAEGITFVAHRLPSFGKAIERALILNCNIGIIPGFALKKNERLPMFLYHLTEKLFEKNGDVKSHEVLKHFNGTVLKCIRQVTMAFSKARDVVVRYDEKSVVDSFIKRVSCAPPILLKGMWVREARKLLKQVFEPDGRLHPSLAQWDSNPYGRHGPGAVFGSEKGCDKWNFSTIAGINRALFDYNGADTLVDDCEALRLNRLELVPKDYRGPRLICIEPKELQFAQQGLLDVINHIVKTTRVTSCDIDFNDQTKSQYLCSRSDLTTIDLKDASDRVTVQLVKLLFPKSVSRILLQYRSTHTVCEEGFIPLATYATMGNALCFPVETLIFWAIARSAIPTNVSRDVRVFGDDIIVPNDYAVRVIENLTAAGLSINIEKTCTQQSLIRESCGAYTFNGHDARIVQLKRSNCSNFSDWISLVDSARDLYSRGFCCASLAICEAVEEFYPVPYGYQGLPPNAEGHKKVDRKFIRWNKDLQRLEARMPVSCVGGRQLQVPSSMRLYAWFVGLPQRSPTSDISEEVKFVWSAV